MRIRLKGSCRPLPRFVQEHPPGPWSAGRLRAHPEGFFYTTSAPVRVSPGRRRKGLGSRDGALKLLALLHQKLYNKTADAEAAETEAQLRSCGQTDL